MSVFDAEQFEAMTFDQANETEYTPVPEGEYLGIVDSVRVKEIVIKKGERAGSSVPVLEVIFDLMDDDGSLKEALNRDKVTVRQDIWLDLTDQGALAFGPNQNVQLGRLRNACGLNKPGKAFAFKQLEGQGPLQIFVANETVDDRVYDRVTRIAEVA